VAQDTGPLGAAPAHALPRRRAAVG
jgi:hypothetical protein